MFQQMPSTMVSLDSMPDGLYLVKRPSQYPLIEHYGVLIVGELLWSFGFYADNNGMASGLRPSADNRVLWLGVKRGI